MVWRLDIGGTGRGEETQAAYVTPIQARRNGAGGFGGMFAGTAHSSRRVKETPTLHRIAIYHFGHMLTRRSSDRGSGRRRRRLLAALLAAVTAATPSVGAAQRPDGWRFSAADGAAAWFAVVRDLEVPAPGPLAYYAAGVPARAEPLRGRLRAPAFEILHFGPLYAPAATTDDLVATLRAAARQADPAPATGRILAAALRATLTADARASRLPALADAIARRRTAERGLDAARRTALASRWETSFAPALRAWFEQQRLVGGTVLVIPALGPEGRAFAGRHDDPFDNVIAVGTWPAAGTPDAALLAMLRELCFPAVTRSLATAAVADRETASRVASNAAIRCGARLADAVGSVTGAAYRRQWAAVVGGRSDDFEARFPVDAELWRPIAAQLDAAFGPGRTPAGLP